jgi:hypothetical protein
MREGNKVKFNSSFHVRMSATKPVSNYRRLLQGGQNHRRLWSLGKTQILSVFYNARHLYAPAIAHLEISADGVCRRVQWPMAGRTNRARSKNTKTIVFLVGSGRYTI